MKIARKLVLNENIDKHLISLTALIANKLTDGDVRRRFFSSDILPQEFREQHPALYSRFTYIKAAIMWRNNIAKKAAREADKTRNNV